MSMTTDKPPAAGGEHLDDKGSYWHSRKTAAAGLVLVLVAAATAWAVLGSGDKPAQTSATAGYDSACGLTGGSTAEPTRGPDVQWQNLDGNWLPVSTTQGPGKRETGGSWSCFARTPSGAVLAAQTISGAMYAADDYAAVVRKQTVPGTGQLAAIKAGQPRYDADQTATPLGFALNSYATDGSVATVTLYFRTRANTARCTSTVQWFGGASGDWLLRLDSTGNSVSSCERVDDLTGADFIAWGPNS